METAASGNGKEDGKIGRGGGPRGKGARMGELTITAEPGMPQVVASWTFDAPREQVFRAFVEPDLVAQWLGPRGVAITVERYEARDGGRWRYLHTDEQGTYAFRGVFHGDPSVEAGIVQTFEFEGGPARSRSTRPRSRSTTTARRPST
jgi:hypothetical protein